MINVRVRLGYYIHPHADDVRIAGKIATSWLLQTCRAQGNSFVKKSWQINYE